VTPTLTFTCSICGEPSVSICVFCTKDACPNHLCERCQRCSDCCECDVRLDEHPEHIEQIEHFDSLDHIETIEDIPVAGDGTTAPESADGGSDTPDPTEPHN
jgi:hypothetical protein